MLKINDTYIKRYKRIYYIDRIKRQLLTCVVFDFM